MDNQVYRVGVRQDLNAKGAMIGGPVNMLKQVVKEALGIPDTLDKKINIEIVKELFEKGNLCQ